MWQTRRAFCAAGKLATLIDKCSGFTMLAVGKSDAVKELFVKELSAITARLNAAVGPQTQLCA